MLERLLVPLDGSPIAESILPQVGVLARGLGQPVVLLMVLPRVEELRPERSGFDAGLQFGGNFRQIRGRHGRSDSAKWSPPGTRQRVSPILPTFPIAPVIRELAHQSTPLCPNCHARQCGVGCFSQTPRNSLPKSESGRSLSVGGLP